MIVLKKIGFLRPFLLHASMLMRFSEEAQREQLSVSAQKAVWATSIIKTISKASLPTSLGDPPLCDVILNLPDPSKQFHFDEAEKNEVMELFTEGIPLASPFLAQTSIKQARQKDNSYKSSYKAKKKFVFFPNRTVTTQMFNSFMKPSSFQLFNHLLTGRVGISKTVSIILFIHLSYHQTRFIYEASKDEKKKEEYNKLLKLGLIPEKVIKYWYWSARKDTTFQIKKLILAQAVELEPAVRAELMKQPYLSEVYQKLDYKYDIPGLHSRSIVDQVNIIAQMMRKSNQSRKKIKSTNPDPRAQAIALNKSFKTFLRITSYFTLISSGSIERKLLERAYQPMLGMELVDSHTGCKTTQIPYEKTMLTEEGEHDFWQTFWFEIERRSNLEAAQLESAKQTFYQNIQNSNQLDVYISKTPTLSAFSRFAYIGEFLSTNYQKLMESLKSQDDLKVQEMIKQFQSFCLKESKQKILTFLEGGDIAYRQCILQKLYFKARSLRDQDQYRLSSFLLTTPQLDEIFNDKIMSRQMQDAKQQYEEAIKDLRSLLVFSTKQVVKFIFSVQQFTLLVEHIVFQKQSKSANLLRSVKQKDQQFRFWRQKIEASFFISTKQNIGLGRRGQSAFEYHFQSAIQIALKNPGKNILTLPFVMFGNLRIRYAQLNPIMDFAILNYDKQLNMFQFYSFDVTDSRDLTQKVIQARKLFTELFQGVTSIKGIPISLNHTYLCPEDASYQQQDISNAPPLAIPLTIMYTGLSNLSVTTQDFRTLSMLCYIVKLITPNKEEEQYDALLRDHDR